MLLSITNFSKRASYAYTWCKSGGGNVSLFNRLCGRAQFPLGSPFGWAAGYSRQFDGFDAFALETHHFRLGVEPEC
jgi:hypothetical protein